MIDRTDQGPVLGAGYFHLFATAIAVFGIVLCFMWANGKSLRPYGFIALAVGLIPWAITAFRFYQLRKKIGKASLDLDDPIPLGFSGTAIYTRPLHDAELASVEVRLQCEEEYVRGSGKNKTTITKVVQDQVLTPAVTPMMQRIEVRIPVRIPTTGPASFSCDVARTKWWVRLKLKMRGCPNTASSFEIDVAPGVLQR